MVTGITEKLEVVDINSMPEEAVYTAGINTSLTILLAGKVVQQKNIHLVIRLEGAGARAKIIGSINVAGNGSCTIVSEQNHNAPGTTSDLLIKSVLSDSSSFRYSGIIRVRQDAQKTDAYQRNENLLASPGVYCDSKPTLEILANDVRCTHGASSGPISDDELWYLNSRGIRDNHAKKLITSGFLLSAADRLSDSAYKEILEEKIWEIL